MNSAFNEKSVAPCGMNCGVCIAYLRDKKPCVGCRGIGEKPKHCNRCIIANCNYLSATASQFCYDCEKFPCTRLDQLDKRYRTKYRTSLIQNLEEIRDKGLHHFLENEDSTRRCVNCGNIISVHRDFCMICKTPILL